MRTVLPKRDKKMESTKIEKLIIREEPRGKTAIWLGAMLVLIGLLANTWTVGQIISLDGTLDSTLARMAVFGFQLLCIGLGIYLMVKRPEVSLINLVLMFGSIGFSLGAVALMVQIFYNPPPLISGWRGYKYAFETNDMGFRGRFFNYDQDDFVILLVGDSQAEGYGCSFDYSPELRLEHQLNQLGKKAKVFSLACAGYGQDQQLLMLEEFYAKNYRADLVLAWETTANDVWNNMFPTHWPTNANPKPTFWLENGKLLGPTSLVEEQISEPKIKIWAMLMNIFPSTSERRKKRDTEWEAKLPQAYQPLLQFEGQANPRWQSLWDEKIGFMPEENLDTEKSHLGFALTPASERMNYGLKLTNKLLKKMESLVERQNGEFAPFTVIPPKPSDWKKEDTYELNGKYYHISDQQYEQNLSAMNRDLNFLKIEISNPQWQINKYDHIHLNEHANDEAMQVLAEKIAPLVPNKVE